MRQVTEEIVNAFLGRRKKAVGNSHTDGESLFLHGNLIARWEGDSVLIRDAGWPTLTTFERINGLLSAWQRRVNKEKTGSELLFPSLRVCRNRWQWRIYSSGTFVKEWNGSHIINKHQII